MDLLTLTTLHAQLGAKWETTDRIIGNLDSAVQGLAVLLLEAEQDALRILATRYEHLGKELGPEQREEACRDLRREIQRVFQQELGNVAGRVTLDSVEQERSR